MVVERRSAHARASAASRRVDRPASPSASTSATAAATILSRLSSGERGLAICDAPLGSGRPRRGRRRSGPGAKYKTSTVNLLVHHGAAVRQPEERPPWTSRSMRSRLALSGAGREFWTARSSRTPRPGTGPRRWTAASCREARRRSGFLGLTMPEEYGGMRRDHVSRTCSCWRSWGAATPRCAGSSRSPRPGRQVDREVGHRGAEAALAAAARAPDEALGCFAPDRARHRFRRRPICTSRAAVRDGGELGHQRRRRCSSPTAPGPELRWSSPGRRQQARAGSRASSSRAERRDPGLTRRPSTASSACAARPPPSCSSTASGCPTRRGSATRAAGFKVAMSALDKGPDVGRGGRVGHRRGGAASRRSTAYATERMQFGKPIAQLPARAGADRGHRRRDGRRAADGLAGRAT